MSRLIAACAVVAVAAACASGPWPRIVSTSDVRARPTTRGEWLASYDQALASIAAILTGELGLPGVDASLYFYRDRDAFQAALVADGYEPEFARETAAALIGVSGHRRVLLNNDALLDFQWPERVALLAHELTHTLQYEFGGGTRGTSEQWLREGFAEWVEIQVLIALGFSTQEFARGVALRRVRAAGADRLPPLSQLVTFPDWVRAGTRLGQEPVYAHALVATEFLLERQGVPAAVEYFKRFASSDDRLDNFRRAFGMELSAFTAEFDEYLAVLLSGGR